MNEHTRKRCNRKHGRSLGHRVLALLLAMLMLFGSTGMQIQAEDSSGTTDGATPEPINLENYLTDNTTMLISVWIDGKKHVYTPDELTAKGLEVPKGSPVKVELYFQTIYGVLEGQTLEYQLPENLMDYSGANEAGYVWQDTVWEENNAGAEVEAGDWTIDSTGKLIVTIRDDFFESNKHDDNTVDLFGFNIKFSGSFSSERGEHSGNGDNVVTFRGDTDGTGALQFTIPFEYKNENANVSVEKTITSCDAATRTATYQIKVTADATNTMTATNVVVTDEILCDLSYIEQEKDSKGNDNGNCYQNYKASNGSDAFDYETGTWTIGEMTPGQEETLTYSLVISEDCYTSGTIDKIQNLATVTFNDDGMNQTYSTLDLPGTVLLEKTVDKTGKNITLTTENGETYMTYTLTATAYGSNMSSITVTDAFNNSAYISKIVVPDGGASQGEVVIDDATASLRWDVGNLEEDQSATLTYRAYLDPDAWQTTLTSSSPAMVKQSFSNSASVYIGNDTTGTPLDDVTVPTTLEKTWVNKAGALITDTSDPKYGKLKFTVAVNGDPVSDNVQTIYDTLTGGTYETDGYIELTRYTSSDKTTAVDTTPIQIKLSDVVSSDGDGYRWDIDLVSRKLNGPYYYELVYYVESSSIQVDNNAGIGFGVGPGYGVSTQVQGAGGMTYGSDYWKSFDSSDNKKESYSQWYVTIQKTVPKGAVYCDWLSTEYVYKHEQFWFDDDTLNDITIEFEGNTLTQGVDYTVVGERANSTDADRTDPDGKRYFRFKITFNNEYLATKTNQMKIKYKVRLNNEPRDEDCLSYSDKCVVLYYNYCRWYLPEYGNLVATNQGANYSHSTYVANTPLKKSNATYNKTDDTLTWTLTVNSQTSIEGDATLEEYIPEGLTFVSAEISSKAFPVTSADTTLGEITQEAYTDSDGNNYTKVSIPIKDLASYVVQSSRFITATNPNGIGTTTGWSRAGEITIKVVTKVDTETRMTLTEDKTVTNKAVLKDNPDIPSSGVTATGTGTIPATEMLGKALASKENPAYLQYALNINPDAMDLSDDSDTLEVVDIMSSGMTLATDHSTSFAVYDVSNVSNLLDSDGNVIIANAKTGTNITDTAACSIKNITGQVLDGMTDDDVGKPTYLITVPDSKHVVVIYWATFEGADGDPVTVSNKASFFYNGKVQNNSAGETSDSVIASEADSSLFVGPFFYVKKTDQWGSAVEGVTYSLYEVTVDSDGNETDRTKLMTKTTSSDETIYFGHRSEDGSSVPQLYKNKLYCLVEESAPAGYIIDSEPYYFEFKEKDHDIVDHPSGTTVHQFISGCTYSFTNQFEGVSYSIPVKKIINGKNIDGDTEFSFTLKPDSGNATAVYTNDSYSTQLSTDGINATITGSGETLFAPLYFKEVGTYSFLLSEDDLSADAISNGYSKDSNTFKVTIVVDAVDGDKLAVTSATFVSQDLSGVNENLTTSRPTFDNASHMSGTITLNATKEVTNRAKPVQAGEFAFTVSVGGEVIAETNDDGTIKTDAAGKPVKKLFYTDENGNIEINIDIDQDDVGTQTYVIKEVSGDDPTITYTDERVKVKVTIAEAGKGRVEATNYEYLTDPVFTNEYKATGAATLEGTKILNNKSTGTQTSVYKGEFNFIVKEGDTQVATGTTEADGSITFTDITYDASDIGVHTYVISEKDDGKLFITYTDETVKVQVTVTDAGDGNLAADVQYVDGPTDDNGHALFINQSTMYVPTGISLDILPYALLVVLAGGIGTMILIRRRKRRTN